MRRKLTNAQKKLKRKKLDMAQGKRKNEAKRLREEETSND